MKNIYLCVDNSGGLCDRLCLGEEGLINNANASIECWNSGQDTEHYDYVTDVENALSILNTDNFSVVKLEENKIYVLENVIIDNSNNNLVNFVDERLMRVIKVSNVEYSEDKTYSIY